MDNWLLIIVGVIFLISIVAGYVRGLLKIGISLLATVLSIVLVMFLAPYVSDALIKWTPADEMIEEKCMEMFMPQISADTLKNADLSGTSLGELNQDQLADINNLDWNQLGINIQDILNIIGEIPKEVQIQEIENAALPEFLKNRLLENNFENAKCTYDTNMNRYVNKKKSKGKVDGVVSIINSVYLLQQDILFDDSGFTVQVC